MSNEAAYKTILVGDDGTPEAERAVTVAFSLARSLRAKLIVLGVLAPPSPESQAEGYGLENMAKARAKLDEKLRHSIEANRNSGSGVTLEVLEGRPEEVIRQRAEEDCADLIVVGRRDIARVRHWLEGSVSESLVRHSRISVLVVPDGHER